MLINSENNNPIIEIFDDLLYQKNSRLFVLREDLIHPEISGNKWRKLKYNIEQAKQNGNDTILTFGGAYSNHIAATAAVGKEWGMKTIGIIRGEEVLPLNSTLLLAKDNGMEFKYVSREEYRNKTNPEFLLKLKKEYGNCFVVPEGGTNDYAVKGCSEILADIKVEYDTVCCACGTGGTVAGLIASTTKKVLGFPVLKGGGFLNGDIKKLLSSFSKYYNVNIKNDNWQLITEYDFGGYAKIKSELIEFVKEFYKKHNIPLDLVYTGKMFYGIYDLLKNTNQLDNQTIVAIHTGGLQGNKGFEVRDGFTLFS